MSFAVQPAALDTYAGALTTLAADTTKAKDYASTHLNLSGLGDSGIFLTILATNDSVKPAVEGMLDRLQTLTSASGGEVTKAAQNYRTMDRTAAARIDAAYPSPSGDDPGLDEGAPASGAVDSPATALVPPVATDPIPDLAQWIFSFPDLISPSHWLLWVLDQVCGVNPAEWFAGEFAGDWEAVQRAGKALAALGEFTEIDAREIRENAGRMLGAWDGMAADAAERYFAGLSDAVGRQPSPLNSMGSEYEAVAFGMWSFAQSIVGLIELLLDWALIAAASAAATAASSWTIIGGIAGAAATAAAIAKTVSVWVKVIEVHGYAADAALAFTGVIAGYLGAIRGLEEQPLPAGAYDHPGV